MDKTDWGLRFYVQRKLPRRGRSIDPCIVSIKVVGSGCADLNV